MAAAVAGSRPHNLKQMAGNLHPFLFVGCWNRIGVPRDTVINAMLATAEEKGVKNIVLGGDNVYPTAEDDVIFKQIKKAKASGKKWEGETPPKHRVKTFEDGIKRFTGLTLIVALGNHNVEDAEVLKAEQRYLPFDKNYHVAEFEDVAVVVFDANILKSEEAQFNEMNEWLLSVLSYLRAKGKSYYFVTHEPFGSFKKGKRTIWGISKDEMEDTEVIAKGSTPIILSTLLTHPPLAVLCADTHHYEEGVITAGSHEIKQIIVGSGGAEYNSYTESPVPFSVGGPFMYSMTSEPIQQYGFLLLESGKHPEFKPVMNWEGEGGRRRRTRRSTRRTHKKLTRHSRRRY